MIQTTKPKGPTHPQPFHLAAERKRKLSEGDAPSSKFESIAEKVIKFSSKTPERFRRRPSPASGLCFCVVNCRQLGLLVIKPFTLCCVFFQLEGLRN